MGPIATGYRQNPIGTRRTLPLTETSTEPITEAPINAAETRKAGAMRMPRWRATWSGRFSLSGRRNRAPSGFKMSAAITPTKLLFQNLHDWMIWPPKRRIWCCSCCSCCSCGPQVPSDSWTTSAGNVSGHAESQMLSRWILNQIHYTPMVTFLSFFFHFFFKCIFLPLSITFLSFSSPKDTYTWRVVATWSGQRHVIECHSMNSYMIRPSRLGSRWNGSQLVAIWISVAFEDNSEAAPRARFNYIETN